MNKRVIDLRAFGWVVELPPERVVKTIDSEGRLWIASDDGWSWRIGPYYPSDREYNGWLNDWPEHEIDTQSRLPEAERA